MGGREDTKKKNKEPEIKKVVWDSEGQKTFQENLRIKRRKKKRNR